MLTPFSHTEFTNRQKGYIRYTAIPHPRKEWPTHFLEQCQSQHTKAYLSQDEAAHLVL